MKSTIDCIKYVVTEMDTDQSVTGRTISIDRLYTSIESTNWLLDRGWHCNSCRKGERNTI